MPPFEYGPRTKGKPNSQGTLFRADPSQRTPASRQPRGYSPERYEAVGKATGMVQHMDKKVNGRRAGYQRGVIGHTSHRKDYADTMDTLARSTVPVEHLKNVHIYAAAKSMGNGNLGEYDRKGYGSGPVISIAPGAGRDETPVHEMGHHVDYESGTIPANTAHSRGQREGAADRYAAEHTRQPGYKRKPLPATDGIHSSARPRDWGSYAGHDFTAVDTFDQAYHKERYGNLNHYQFSQHTEPETLKQRGLPKGHVEGQLPLLVKSSYQSYDNDMSNTKTTHTNWGYTADHVYDEEE